MALTAHVGRSQEKDPLEAGRAACIEAMKGVGGKAEIIIAFVSSSYDTDRVLSGIKLSAGAIPTIGATTAAVIATEGVLREQSVVVLALNTNGEVRFIVNAASGLKENETQTAETLLKGIFAQVPKEELRGIVVFPDGIAGNTALFTRTLSQVFENTLSIVGGTASDDFQFLRTTPFAEGKAIDGGATLLGLAGNVYMSVGVGHGWRPIGLPTTVTESDGSMLKMLDGKPAVQLYDKYFGEMSHELKDGAFGKLAVTYPLGIREKNGTDVVIRNPLSSDDGGGLLCAAEILQGVEVRLMIGSKDAAILAARQAAQDALLFLKGKEAKAILLFSSIARKKLLGERGNDEISAVHDVFGHNIPIIGMYTYGEIGPTQSPIKGLWHTVFHNETFVVCALA